MGPSLYSFKGAVYDRAADVDVKVKADAQRAAMIIRKQNFYTEKTVYPWVTKEDLDLAALSGVRREIRSARENHLGFPLMTKRCLELRGSGPGTPQQANADSTLRLLCSLESKKPSWMLLRCTARMSFFAVPIPTDTMIGLFARATWWRHTGRFPLFAKSGCPMCLRSMKKAIV